MLSDLRLNRATPKGPEHMYRTYAAKAPIKTHFRVGTCAEYECEKYTNGWRVHLEPLTEELRQVIRTSGKRFTKEEVGEGLTYLIFLPGQNCFDGDARRHMVRIGRPELFLVAEGDWRTNRKPQDWRVHKHVSDWVDQMQTTAEKITTALQRG